MKNYKAEFECVYEKLKAEEKLSEHYKQELAISENLGRMQAYSTEQLIKEIESLKCCGNCIYYEEHNGYCKGEWDKNKRHLCQLWRDYNG